MKHNVMPIGTFQQIYTLNLLVSLLLVHSKLKDMPGMCNKYQCNIGIIH